MSCHLSIFSGLPLIVNAMKAQRADAEDLVMAPAACNFDGGTLACAAGQDVPVLLDGPA